MWGCDRPPRESTRWALLSGSRGAPVAVTTDDDVTRGPSGSPAGVEEPGLGLEQGFGGV
jgi:hypothetical protein